VARVAVTTSQVLADLAQLRGVENRLAPPTTGIVDHINDTLIRSSARGRRPSRSAHPANRVGSGRSRFGRCRVGDEQANRALRYRLAALGGGLQNGHDEQPEARLIALQLEERIND
jgi:hypothetical protein